MRDFASDIRKQVRTDAIQTVTVREFNGGWNVIDNELNLDQKYAVILDNTSREEDGSVGVRWGTRLLTSILEVDWVDPNDIELQPFDSGSAEGIVGTSDVGLSNPNAFYDGTTTHDMSASTYMNAMVKKGEEAILTCIGVYPTPTEANILYAHAPSEGWVTGASNDVLLTLKFEVFNGTEWIMVREQPYTVGSAPSTFFAPNEVVVPPVPLTQVRFTMTLSPSKNINITMGVAETQSVAYIGTGQLPADTYIVNTTYFQDSIIVNLSNGAMLRVLGDGTMTVIWSEAIAVAGGAPGGWSETDFVSYAVFNGQLIVCNGTDKPLLVDFREPEPVVYLQDLATGSNANVPVCRYVVTFNKFLVMAGDAQFPDRVYISNEGTSGTWVGDADPNNAVNVDLGKVGVQTEQTITGLNRFRDTLVVTFWSAIVLGKLGIYNDEDAHTPNFDDVIESIGCHSHRTLNNIGKDLFMLDHQGIPSLARTIYSGQIEPKRVSELIDPEVNKNVSRLTDSDVLLGAHSVYNTNDKQYMCFVPNYSEGDTVQMPTNPLSLILSRKGSLRVFAPSHGLLVGDTVTIDGIDSFNVLDVDTVNGVRLPVLRVINEDYFEIAPEGFDADFGGEGYGGGSTVTMMYHQTETLGYVYTFVDELKVKAWARYRGWNWRASCVTELGRVVLSDDTRLFVLGYENDPIHSDFVGTTDEAPIEWIFELPWTDFDKRMHTKHTRYMQLDTLGTASFTVMMFVDDIYKIEGQLYPYIMLDVVGSDRGGYGYNPQQFGGGRNTRDQRLFDWTTRGKLAKLRFQGSTTRPLRIIAVSLAYQSGSLRR